jgi:hypothetical protein
MDLYEYWLEHTLEMLGLNPNETDEQQYARIKDWHEHLWDTL